jgi:predicted lipoprotein with Yx(FWY)xxD motif
MRPFGALLAIVACAVIVSGCGDGDSGGYGGSSGARPDGDGAAPSLIAARDASRPSARGGGPRVEVVDSDYGRVIADGKGEALYLFDREKRGRSACYGDCAKAWPPLLAEAGGPVAAEGARQGLLGTTRRRNGKLQVTYAGHPLYYYVHDTPGEILCHDVAEFGGLWLVVRPNGRPAP